jgi:signal transduction histidine kinase
LAEATEKFERRKAVEELKRSHDQLRNLAFHLQSIREEERMKIAREIHDELGQALAAHKMELSWFRDRYGDHKPILDKAGAMLESLNETLRSVRRICTELRPAILDDFGLVDAIQWQAGEFQKRTRIECVVDSAPEDLELDKERSTALFRIFQESLTNVFKHAKATKVITRLTKNNDNIMLEIIDNGKGITNEQLFKPQSFGLLGMRERVYPWKGKVEVTGYENEGTKVKVSVPSFGFGVRKDLSEDQIRCDNG